MQSVYQKALISQTSLFYYKITFVNFTTHTQTKSDSSLKSNVRSKNLFKNWMAVS